MSREGEARFGLFQDLDDLLFGVALSLYSVLPGCSTTTGKSLTQSDSVFRGHFSLAIRCHLF